MAYRNLIIADTPDLYWPLDATYGVNDQSSGGTNDGTAAGGATVGGFAGSPISGETTSTDLDGTDDRINSSYNPFTNGTTRTYTGWAYRDTSTSDDRIFSSSAAISACPILQLSSGTTNVLWGPGGTGGTFTTWTSAWPGNTQWVHWALIFNETTNDASLYINGAFVSTQANATAYNASPGTLQVGASFTTGLGAPFDGKQAHFAVFTRALTASEIQGHYRAGVGASLPTSIRVRELPPLRQHVLATAPTGKTYRWGQDERRPENNFQGLSYSTVMPGGNENFACELPRKTGVNYQDLTRLSTLTVMGAGGRIAGEFRLEKAPRASGETLSISPQAVGWQAHLEDDASASEIYVDRDLSHWESASAARKVALYGTYHVVGDPTTNSDVSTAGVPALQLAFQGTGGAINGVTEAWYDAGPGATVKDIYYDYTSNWTTASYDGRIGTSDDNVGTTTSLSGDLITGVDSSGSGTQSSTAYRFGVASIFVTGISPVEADHVLNFRRLAVWGNHGLTKQGTAPNDGVYASDVIANAVGRWAPLLNYSTGANGTISPTSFVIPQLEFRDKTSAAEIIKQANRFHLSDWAVWDGGKPGHPTFYYHERGGWGRRWRARVGPAKLQETGPQVDRLWNAAIVTYLDADGTTKSVGPTWAGTDATSTTLEDDDPLNPINQLGINRPAVLDMGIVSTSDAATEVGRRFLERSQELDQSGSAELVGHVTDDKGIVHPAWAVRAGDQISFVDAADPSYRRIVKTNYEHDSRTNSIDLDAPPEGMESLLERLSVSLFTSSPGPAVSDPFFAGANPNAPMFVS